METTESAAIDVVEASYDLELATADWLPSVLRAGRSLFDFGAGSYGVLCAGAADSGVPVFTQVVPGPGGKDLPRRVWQAAEESGSELVAQFCNRVNCSVTVLSELREEFPRAYELLTESVGCKDMLSLVATDPNYHGVNITIPSAERIRFTPRQREYWQMINVHLAAGHRLRSGLTDDTGVAGAPITEMPLQAEAMLDPTRFLIAHASGEASNPIAAKRIREAARLIDRARGGLRKRDPEGALRIWRGLVRGKWSLIDWFDSDGRRFVLAKPNAPRVPDPRGLRQREALVATYASLGESLKLVSYRTGLSESTVSRTLNSAMRKLGVKTQAQLVEKLRGFPELVASPPREHEEESRVG